MYRVTYGGRNGQRFDFDLSEERVAVRTQRRTPVLTARPFEITQLSPYAHDVLREFELELRLPEAGVEILRPANNGGGELRDLAREVLAREPEIRFAGRVLVEPEAAMPVLYTENFFVKFGRDVRTSEGLQLLTSLGLTVKRELAYARSSYFVSAKEGTGLDVFAIAERLLHDPRVELCHPELIRRLRYRNFFAQQWHLGKTTLGGTVIDASANVVDAWRFSTGKGVTIAVIDNGVDVNHEEFASAGKVVAPRDVTRGNNDPRPGQGDNHGTACAGVACANGSIGASGVAPDARLLPIRLVSGLGSQAEADAFTWAADHGADVISCSWGPADGRWNDPADPVHNMFVPLPDSTRLAIDYAVERGRAGKGCVVLFAAGNGNESVDNDGYASYSNVMAVAACNDAGVHSIYSDRGRAVWCTFPSSDVVPTHTPGIWTTDRTGADGYNHGSIDRGDASGNYTNSFGGTSSAAPGAAGVAALLLSRNPELSAVEVRGIFRRSCDRIDPGAGNYDRDGHSLMYGFGRLNAATAVRLAGEAITGAQPTGTFMVTHNVPIRDLDIARLAIQVAESRPIRSVTVSVDIQHGYIGDLIVRLIPPEATGSSPIVLHDRVGSSTHDVRQTYNPTSRPELARLAGHNPAGTWTLEASDQALEDEGTLRAFRLDLTF